jgi:hypothetical protein
VTVNANVRCIEWFDASHTLPIDCRFVLGYYDDGHIRRCRLMGGEKALADFIELVLNKHRSY